MLFALSIISGRIVPMVDVLNFICVLAYFLTVGHVSSRCVVIHWLFWG